MNRGEWDALIATLDRKWREFAQAMMRRINHLLNEERNERLGDVQRLDRRIDRLKERQDRLEGHEATPEQDQSDRGADGARPG